MLARYLKTRPTRYAIHPAHADPAYAQAIRNFLLFQTRAQNMPALAQQSGQHLAHPLLQSLLGGVLHEQDPTAVGMLHDASEEHGVPRTGQSGRLIALLSNLHRIVSGSHPHATLPLIRQHYGGLHDLASVFPGDDDSEVEAERKYNLGQTVRGTADEVESPVYDLMRSFAGTPHFDDLRRNRTAALGSVPAAIPGLYDALHAASQGQPSRDTFHANDEAGRLRDVLAHHMRSSLLPAIHGRGA
jgi:hypothetical protein